MMLLALVLAAAPETNLLSLEAGTVIVQAPASWGGTWPPEALSDGDLHTGWCNAVGTKRSASAGPSDCWLVCSAPAFPPAQSMWAWAF